MSQYADDTSLTLLAKEVCVNNSILTLKLFSEGSGLTIIWNKSAAYWWGPEGAERPAWTQELAIQWAQEGEISKLLGAPFGLNLQASNINQFLEDKSDRKFKY